MCNCNSTPDEIYLYIDSDEYFIGNRSVYMAVKEIAGKYNTNQPYQFKQINKKNGAIISGSLVFKGTMAYVNGTPLI